MGETTRDTTINIFEPIATSGLIRIGRIGTGGESAEISVSSGFGHAGRAWWGSFSQGGDHGRGVSSPPSPQKP